MTDPKNPEAQNEELDLQQLEDAAGGATAIEYGLIAAAKPRRKKADSFTVTDNADNIGTCDLSPDREG